MEMMPAKAMLENRMTKTNDMNRIALNCFMVSSFPKKVLPISKSFDEEKISETGDCKATKYSVRRATEGNVKNG